MEFADFPKMKFVGLVLDAEPAMQDHDRQALSAVGHPGPQSQSAGPSEA
jgi:hypothetical protein